MRNHGNTKARKAAWALALALSLGSLPAKAVSPIEWMLLQGAFNWVVGSIGSAGSGGAGQPAPRRELTMDMTSRWANKLASKGVVDLGGGAKLGLAQAAGPGALAFDVSLAERSSELNPAILDAQWAPGLKKTVCARGSFWRTWLIAGGSLTYRIRGSDGGLARGYYAQEKDCRGL